MSEIDVVRREFVQLWGSMAAFWGISPTTAKVHSWLLAATEPADADEIMEALEMSRGAVSMACRELRDWGLIFSEKEPGARRVTYRPATDPEKVIKNIIERRKHREWDPILEGFREWIPRLLSDPSPEAAVVRARMESLESLVAQADTIVEIFLKEGLLGRLGLKLLRNVARDKSAAKTTKAPESTLVEELILEES